MNISTLAQQSSTPPRAALSWRAGKDGCLAWLRVCEQGIDVSTFGTMCDGDGPSLSHALPREWLARQAAACGVTWRAVDVHRSSPGGYAADFDRTLAELHRDGHTHRVFGDFGLAAHRDWIAPRCEAAGLVPLFPLWGESRVALAQEVIARGIQARLVAVDPRRLDAAFCGAPCDAALLARLPLGVCSCGEEGEFYIAVGFAHGMLHAVPLLDRGVQVVASAPPLSPTRIARLAFE